MLIGEISKQSQLSRDTIRFYEKKGLIKVQASDSLYNNYKNYTKENLEQLLLIKKLKKFGFTLNEIAELLELIKVNRASCSIFRKKVMTKIESIDKKIQELKEMKSSILLQVDKAQLVCLPEQKDSNCKQLYPIQSTLY